MQVGGATSPVPHDKDGISGDLRVGHTAGKERLVEQPHCRVEQRQAGHRASKPNSRRMNAKAIVSQQLEPIAHEHAVPESRRPGGIRRLGIGF